MKKILFVAPFLGPPFNEAWKNNVKALSQELGGTVIVGCKSKEEIETLPSNYSGVYFKSKYLRYLVHAFLSFKLARKAEVVFFELLPHTLHAVVTSILLDRNKCVYRVISDYFYEHKNYFNRYFLKRVLRKFRYVLVTDRKSRVKYLNVSGSQHNVLTLSPGIDLTRFKPAPVPHKSPFILIMASAPFSTHINWQNYFFGKGISFLLEAMGEMKTKFDVKLILIWRSVYLDKIQNMLREMKLMNDVEVVNDFVDMREYYEKSHLTIMPALEPVGTPQYPNSIMESLASGRPVIVSYRYSISSIVRKERCGIGITPSAKDIISAMEEIRKNYDTFQTNCRKTAEKYFDNRRNIKILKEKLARPL